MKLIKKYLLVFFNHAVLTVITLLLLSVAIQLNIKIYDAWPDINDLRLNEFKPEAEHHIAMNTNNQFLKINNTKIERNTDIFVLSGFLTNIDKYYWRHVSIGMDYLIDGIEVGYCGSSNIRAYSIEPEKTYFFSIDCPYLDPGNLPEGLGYKIIVSGFRYLD